MNSFEIAGEIQSKQYMKVCNHYSLACDVPCQVIDSRGATLHRSRPDLAIVDSSPDVHLYGSYQAERFGGRYVYFSPNGLTYWASPIIAEGEMMGALVAGPVHMGERDDFQMDEFLASFDIPDDHSDWRSRLESISTLSPDRVHSLSELLYLAARSLSDKTFDLLDKSTHTAIQQSDWCQQIGLEQPGDIATAYPIEKERQLLEFVEAGDKAGAQLVLNEILGAVFFTGNTSPSKIVPRVTELVVLLSRAAIRGGADVQQIFGLNYLCLKKIQSFRTVDEIAYWLSGIMARFTDQVFNLANVKHADMIYQAKDYVKKHYMNKISLEEAAAQVYLSPAYFSRMFKELAGENFNVYVNQVRIENAKKILMNDTIALADISMMVGFEDQSYFSKVFKKMTGVTPNKYRESRGKIKPQVKS